MGCWNQTHAMKYHVLNLTCIVLFATGCATMRDASPKVEREGIARGYYILSTTNCPPGASFDVTVYVVATGDSISSVSQRFGCSRQKLIELNPSLETNFPPLTIGQRLRVRELRIDEGKE